MRTTRLLALAAAGVLSVRAQAESLFAFELPISPQGTNIGKLSNARIELVRWIDDTSAVVRFEDADMRLDTPVVLARPAVRGGGRALVVVGVGRRVPLVAGTPLYGSPEATTPFGVLRREVVAWESLARRRGFVCTREPGQGRTRCEPDPPPPVGPQTLLFDRADGAGAVWTFVAHVRLPFESLPRDDEAETFAHCRDRPEDWPH